MEQLKKSETTRAALPNDTADNSYVFLYWDDPGDSQESVDNQKPKDVSHMGHHSPCSMHAAQQEWDEMEDELNKRMDIIGQNGNTGEHYELAGEGA
jgi:hypothetical protein